MLAPRADLRSLAIVVDPTGATLALQKYPFEKNGYGGPIGMPRPMPY